MSLSSTGRPDRQNPKFLFIFLFPQHLCNLYSLLGAFGWLGTASVVFSSSSFGFPLYFSSYLCCCCSSPTRSVLNPSILSWFRCFSPFYCSLLMSSRQPSCWLQFERGALWKLMSLFLIFLSLPCIIGNWLLGVVEVNPDGLLVVSG